jgi:hypothetical protein
MLGRYEYNVVLGEGRAFRFDGWCGRAEVEGWFDAGADGASSGDLYARLAPSARPEASS